MEHFAAEQGLVTLSEVLTASWSVMEQAGKKIRGGGKRGAGREVEKTGGSRVMSLLNLSLCHL